MADDVRVTNMPGPGSSEAIAFELWKYLRDSNASSDDQLKFFTRCHTAVGARDSAYYDLFK